MLKILIVDDSSEKIKHVENVLLRYEEISAHSWHICSNARDAKKVLRDHNYDLLVLDIQIPLREGEAPQREGGADLLRELHSRSCYKKPGCIVGLTEYSELLGAFEDVFAGRLWSLVLYSQSSDDWSERLSRKLEYLLEKKKDCSNDLLYGVDLCVLTALNVPEFSGLLSLGGWNEEKVAADPARYWRTTFESQGKRIEVVASHAPQMGMAATAVSATKMIAQFRPKYLAMVGISAGIPGLVNIGDLIVADPSWDWGNGKQSSSPAGVRFDPEPLQERLNPAIRALFEDVKRDATLLESCWAKYGKMKPATAPRLHIGPCASGSCVLADEQKRDSIKGGNRKLIGIDMEAYGLMYAVSNALHPVPKAFSMKAVCDFADAKKTDGFQEYGSCICADALREISLKYF